MGKCESCSRTQCSHDHIDNSVCASDPTSGHWGNYSFCNRVIIGGVCVEAGAHQIAARCGQNDVRTNTTQTTNKTQTHHLCVEVLVNSARAYPTDIIDIVPDVLALTCRYLCTLLRACSCRTESRTEIEERQATAPLQLVTPGVKPSHEDRSPLCHFRSVWLSFPPLFGQQGNRSFGVCCVFHRYNFFYTTMNIRFLI